MAQRRPRRADPGEDIVPGWRVVAVLGGGAVTEAVLATDGRSRVVLKAARPGREEQARRSLASEAALLGRLSDPGLPRLMGAEIDGPVPHVRIEHIDGPRLSSRVRRAGPLDPAATARLGHDIGATLAAIHAADVVHLDVKPGNVVLGDPPHLVDLGGARSLSEAARTRRPVGTRRWMAPEQRAPAAFGGMGPEADVWGLAATLHLCALGRGPFDHLAVPRLPDGDGGRGRDYPVSRRDVDRLALPESLPAPLREVILACLRWEPDDRWRMTDVVAALRPG